MSSESSFNVDAFASPSPAYRPVPFWSWNEIMEPDEIRRQVNLFAAAGMGGVMLHSRIGLLTPYMGDAWFKAIAAAIDEAGQRGIRAWLYDEDKWPSGVAGGDVVADHPEFRMQALTVRPAGAPTPADCEPMGASSHGLQIFVWRSPLGCEQFNGTAYASLLDPKAMRKFLDLAYEPYAARFGKQFGAAIPAIFTDEPCSLFRRRLVHPALPYATNVPEAFRQMFGYDPLPHLAKLFSETEGFREFRLHYHRVINHLFETSFTKQLGDWCRAHGIAFTGHFLYEQGLVEQQLWGVDIMPNYRHMDIPGIDHLGRQVTERVTAIQCRSVAAQYGKPMVMSELYGASSQDLSFEDRKWICEQQLCLGVNQFVPHLSLYTLGGCRKRDFPPTISYQQPWWPQNRVVDDHLARLCAALTPGEYLSELAVLHPQESMPLLWTPIVDPALFDSLMEYDHDPVQKDRLAQLERINQDFKSLTDELLGAQRTFDYAHEKLIEEAGRIERTNQGPSFVIERVSYPAIVMPSMLTIRPRTLELLLEFIAAGGKVVHVGQFPEFVDAKPDTRLAELRAKVRSADSIAQLPALLSAVHPPAVVLVSEQARKLLWIHRRRIGEQQVLFMVNLSRQEGVTGSIRWNTTVGMTIANLNPSDGRVTPQSCEPTTEGSLIPIALAPGESRLLLASPPSALLAPAEEERPAKASSRLMVATWHVERLDDNVLPLDTAHYRLGNGPWSTRAVPVMAVQEYLNGSRYDGPLTLRYSVDNRLSGARKVHLIAEYSERWQIAVNGTPISYQGLPPWIDFRWLPIDIGGHLVQGSNTIECHAAQFRHGDLCCYQDPAGRYGTEAESLLLVGDFGVEGKPTDDQVTCPLWREYSLPPPRTQALAGPFALVDPKPLTPGDVTVQGLPFYAGRLRYRSRIDAERLNGTLRLGRLDATVAAVGLNGAPAGTVAWAPYTLKLRPPAGAGPGSVLDITLHNSLRNLIGPHHHPQGMMPVDYPGAYTADPYRVREPDGSDKAWLFKMERGETHAGWNPRYMFTQYGLIEPTWLD